MAETMLERAAKVLDVAIADYYDAIMDGSVDAGSMQAIARAVIASLREPSEAVTDAVDDVVTESTCGYAMADLWRAGIDAILTEEGETR